MADARVVIGEEQEQTERISVSLGASGLGLEKFVEVAVVEQVCHGVADRSLFDLALEMLHLLGHGGEAVAFGVKLAGDLADLDLLTKPATDHGGAQKDFRSPSLGSL